MIVAMLLAFVGQSVIAASITCPMPSDHSSPADMVHMNGMDHSTHSMPEPMDANQSPEPCCDNGSCVISSCAGSSMISAPVNALDSPYRISEPNAEYSLSHLNPTLLSLFRPPINR